MTAKSKRNAKREAVDRGKRRRADEDVSVKPRPKDWHKRDKRA